MPGCELRERAGGLGLVTARHLSRAGMDVLPVGTNPARTTALPGI
ncbi:hypothetical protein AB0L65_38475 [Nonomuraea sp. NPDC052116]